MTLLTEQSFEGFLTAVFEAFRLKLPVQRIVAEEIYVPQMFEDTHAIATNSENAARVWKGIQKNAGNNIAFMVQAAYLSELPEMEVSLWEYVKGIFAKPENAQNTLEPHTHAVFQIANKVKSESHNIKGFVRFQKAENDLMVAVIEPTYNVVNLLAEHFANRFPNMQWMIVDVKRGLGIHYDCREVYELYGNAAEIPKINDEFAELWKGYYKSANIKERKNPKLQRRCLPVKYWKHLTEMN
ncbi:MAG: TIGR03915 family putative DNA repair protein [Fibromonadaceae bacterium]|jgi:probable DNA metabolism protein|nr:TIGR03915 family putative DNA repair protein [Fibromonadaceae bacterium]